MSKGKVAVVGLDFSGIFAARAADDLGYDVIAYKFEEPSVDSAAHWLSWVPADIALEVPATSIELIPIGNEASYLKLKWGRIPAISKSFRSDFPMERRFVHGFNPEKVYKAMLPKNVKKLTHCPSTEEIYQLTREYDAVFQTFPAEESFEFQNPMLPFVLAIVHGKSDPNENRIWYNGEDMGHVVAHSNLWGNSYFEFPMNVPFSEIKRVLPADLYSQMEFKHLRALNQFTREYQPLAFTPSNLYFVGKYAEWNPYREYHQVYDRVEDILDEK